MRIAHRVDADADAAVVVVVVVGVGSARNSFGFRMGV